MSRRLWIDPVAADQARAADAWWRANRGDAPALFADEFASALERLTALPRSAPVVDHLAVPDLRRALLAGSRYHLYYRYDEGSDTLAVLAVWSAVRGRRPPIAGDTS